MQWAVRYPSHTTEVRCDKIRAPALQEGGLGVVIASVSPAAACLKKAGSCNTNCQGYNGC